MRKMKLSLVCQIRTSILDSAAGAPFATPVMGTQHVARTAGGGGGGGGG